MPRYAESEEFELCPEGVHLCSLNDIKDVKTSTNKSQWNFVFETEKVKQENGRAFMLFARCFTNISHFCKTFDPNNSWTPGVVDVPSYDFDALIGNYFDVTVKHVEYNGKLYANVMSILPANAPKPLVSPEDLVPIPPDPNNPLGIGDPFANE